MTAEIERYFDALEFKNRSELAVCHFIATVGKGYICSSLAEPIETHDRMSRANNQDLRLC